VIERPPFHKIAILERGDQRHPPFVLRMIWESNDEISP
jgi:hypothetical protein